MSFVNQRFTQPRLRRIYNLRDKRLRKQASTPLSLDCALTKVTRESKDRITYARVMEAKVKQKEHRADALALRADERRDKLR